MVALQNDYERFVSFSDLTIMIVDDNQYMRNLIGHMLRAFEVGIILDTTNAKDAFEQIGQSRIDCLIVDWLMPGGMSGIEFVKIVRTSPKSPRPDIPLVLCTGHTDRDRVIEARDAGVSEVLTKPVSPRALMHKLRLAIYYPRPFIINPNYTGPDRRRRNQMKYKGVERRRSAGLHQDDIDALLKG